jgi:hypothetical protein
MLIANPIYDTIFKALMQNKRMAKFFIGTLLDCTVIDVDFRPQERAYSDDKGMPRLFRVDFVAVVKTEDGESRKILIEVQKARVPGDVTRFRHYIGEHYSMEGSNDTFPLVCIYMFGFDLDDFPYPCVKVGRTYTDMLTGRNIEERNSFLEHVTHDGYLVQVGRIPEKLGKSRLEELLAIFEQKNLLEHGKTKELNAQGFTDADAIAMADTLRNLAADNATRKELEMEMEVLTMDDILYERDLVIAQKDEYLARAEEVLAQKDEVLAQKDEELAKEKEALARKDEELAKEKEALAAALAEIERLKGNTGNTDTV